MPKKSEKNIKDMRYFMFFIRYCGVILAKGKAKEGEIGGRYAGGNGRVDDL
jgi:hypothetical protein